MTNLEGMRCGVGIAGWMDWPREEEKGRKEKEEGEIISYERERNKQRADETLIDNTAKWRNFTPKPSSTHNENSTTLILCFLPSSPSVLLFSYDQSTIF
jgi:hypothetical protein